MNIQKKIVVLFIISTQLIYGKPPRLTMIIILDQFAHHELQTLKDNFNGGIKRLYENGISYEQAFVPHAMPETSVGHAAFATGALPKDHGIVANSWYNQNHEEVSSDQDSVERAAVFAPQGLYDFGKSARNCMVDGLSDQIVMQPATNKKYAAVAISHKSRAATAAAGQLGKAFWFDLNSGFFTSSKAYFEDLPQWVTDFNAEKKINQMSSVVWQLKYPKKKSAYAMCNRNYRMSGSWGLSEDPGSLIGKKMMISKTRGSEDGDKGSYELFTKTPAGNQLLIDFTKACLDEYLDEQKVQHLVVWLSCSTSDRIGHPYGPYSLEKIDALYHLDAQLEEIVSYAQRKVGDENAFFVLTSDHGIAPIPELVQQKGYTAARRMYTPALVKAMNQLVERKYNLQDLVIGARDTNFYLDLSALKKMSPEKKEQVLNTLKNYLAAQPGIKKVWTFNELADAPSSLQPGEFEALYKNQLFKGRSGHLICQPYPYVLMTQYPHGTGHTSPYTYDTHIPLILYQKNKLKRAAVFQQVFAQQLPVTLAHLLNVPAPSAATFGILPGLF